MNKQIEKNFYKAKKFIEENLNETFRKGMIINHRFFSTDNFLDFFEKTILKNYKDAVNNGTSEDVEEVKYICKVLEHTLFYKDEAKGETSKGFEFLEFTGGFHSFNYFKQIDDDFIIKDIKENGIEGPYKIPFKLIRTENYGYGIIHGNFNLDLDNLNLGANIERMDVKYIGMLKDAFSRILGKEYKELQYNISRQLTQVYQKYKGEDIDGWRFNIYLSDPFAKRVIVHKYHDVFDENHHLNNIEKTTFDIDFTSGKVTKKVDVREFFKMENISEESYIDEDFNYSKNKIKENPVEI